MTETTALLPCPLCGAADPLVQDIEPHKHAIAGLPDHPGSATVECPACAIGLIKPTRAEAIAAWNRRATPAAHSDSPAPAVDGWMDPATYRKDGTLVRLLIECQPGGQDENPTSDVGDGETWVTIGSNGFEVTEVDEWQFAGWDWCQDRWTEGRGKVVGWMPYHSAPSSSPDTQAAQGEALTDASSGECRRILEEMTALFEMGDEANEPGTDSYTVLWQAREFLKGDTPPAGEGREAPILWCVHAIGPDDLYPVESYEAAVKMADSINDRSEAFNFGHKPDSMDYVFLRAYPAPWTGSAEQHASLMAAALAAARTQEPAR